MLWYQVATIFATIVHSVDAQCLATTEITIGAGVSATVSSQTSAAVVSGGTAFVEECGTASIGYSALGTISGGTATVQGLTYGYLAQATVTSRGRIPYANFATVTVAPSATVTVDSGGNLEMTAGDGASIEATGRTNEWFYIAGGDITVSAFEWASAYVTAAGGYAYYTGQGGGAGAFASGATVMVVGTNAFADVENGGVATLSGSGGICSIGSGTCTVAGTSQYVYCYESGSADILGGTANDGSYGAFCSGTISGAGNQVTLSSLASATVKAGATVTAEGGAGVYVSGDVSNVYLSDAATATMMPGALVTAAAQAVVQGSGPFVRVRSVSEVDVFTIYTAEQVGTNQRRSLPAPTPRCADTMTTCPDLRGGFKCVDTKTDIFNCGGCNFGKNTLRVGVDCTEGQDGEVACIDGQCIAR